MPTRIDSICKTLEVGQDLNAEEAFFVFGRVMDGSLADRDIRILLERIAAKGESVNELVGAARAMRDSVRRIECQADCIDTCGTGGDGVSTFNVSTTAAIIAAAVLALPRMRTVVA